jgi:HD-GYP domain-containing protein (c-di-GMP phosphodiesterase class II)
MTSDRPYRKAMSWSDAGREIFEQAGRQFDPGVVEAFAERELALLEIREALASMPS